MGLQREMVWRCAITDVSSSASGDPETRLRRLTNQVRAWSLQGLDIVQLREKALEAGELLRLAQTATEVTREIATVSSAGHEPAGRTLLLVNGRADVAAAAGADGVHLPSRPEALRPAQVRHVFHAAGLSRCFISASCHTLDEVMLATESGVDLILFGPVYEKRVAGAQVHPGLGLEALRQAARAARFIPVLALGGVTAENSAACLEAGASGVAGIRLFEPVWPRGT